MKDKQQHDMLTSTVLLPEEGRMKDKQHDMIISTVLLLEENHSNLLEQLLKEHAARKESELKFATKISKLETQASRAGSRSSGQGLPPLPVSSLERLKTSSPDFSTR
ncbi:hypothetical protein DSO57_1030373 [Entomophthora muscae]|uniref:Uncharacterized protein n=1 Tax=Entomophthora muscae TaxID=34485 RepID=A0ACC2TC17_9FUNG|nr:hypothetical protein DSO57_1030373 [Entomophthora muscae]